MPASLPPCLPAAAVFVTKVEPNYSQPWQMCPQRSSTGSAFVLDAQQRTILTNSHVVSNVYGPCLAAGLTITHTHTHTHMVVCLVCTAYTLPDEWCMSLSVTLSRRMSTHCRPDGHTFSLAFCSEAWHVLLEVV